MRTAQALLLLAALLFGCGQPGSKATDSAVGPRSSLPVTAISFNIRYGTADDGPDAWPLRRESVARLLVESGADLIGLQEALEFQLEYLDRVLPNHRRVGQGREGGSRGEYTAIYYDTRRWELVHTQDRWLSKTPEQIGSVGWDAALTRMCTQVVLRDSASGREWSIWNTHFDHRGKRAREESARLLIHWMGRAAGPLVLLGDLNAGEDSPPLQALREGGLRDAFRDLHPDRQPVGTFHDFRGGLGGDKIDFVLVNASIRTLAAAILDQPGPNGRWPSDHHAVVAVLAATD